MYKEPEKMSRMSDEQLEELFERYCDRCLRFAVSEYLHRSRHSELVELEYQIGLRLEAPCKTDVCQAECHEVWDES